MKVSFYLARPTIVGVDGKPQINPNPTVIFCRISYEGYRLKYYTPENILPKFWNGKAKPHRVKETTKFPEYPEFNKRLNDMESDIRNTIRAYINDNSEVPRPEILKPLIDIVVLSGGKIEKITFIKYLSDYIERCKNGTVTHAKTGKPLTAGTIKSYKTTLFNIERYITDTRKKVEFENIDLDFYTSFTDYLTSYTSEESKKEKQSLNTIGKYIKIIKTILNEATERGINKNLSYKSKKFLTASEDAETIYLTESELKELEDLDLTGNPRLDCIRDLFLVGCSTGLRFSDLSTLTPSQIKGNMINITQIKTGKPVIIPIHDRVTMILKKYDGKLPKAISNQKTNEYLKDVCKMTKSLKRMVGISGVKAQKLENTTVPKWQLVSTHTARRSFATNEYLAGVPPLTIMAITGHKTEKAFLKYIRVTSDQHARILQDIWANRKEKQVKIIAI